MRWWERRTCRIQMMDGRTEGDWWTWWRTRMYMDVGRIEHDYGIIGYRDLGGWRARGREGPGFGHMRGHIMKGRGSCNGQGAQVGWPPQDGPPDLLPDAAGTVRRISGIDERSRLGRVCRGRGREGNGEGLIWTRCVSSSRTNGGSTKSLDIGQWDMLNGKIVCTWYVSSDSIVLSIGTSTIIIPIVDAR